MNTKMLHNYVSISAWPNDTLKNLPFRLKIPDIDFLKLIKLLNLLIFNHIYFLNE